MQRFSLLFFTINLKQYTLLQMGTEEQEEYLWSFISS